MRLACYSLARTGLAPGGSNLLKRQVGGFYPCGLDMAHRPRTMYGQVRSPAKAYRRWPIGPRIGKRLRQDRLPILSPGCYTQIT